MNLFCDRLRVGIADTVPTGIARAIGQGQSEAMMALDGYTDVPYNAKATMLAGLKQRNGLALLSSFWSTFANQVKVEAVHSRLLINPPPGLARLGEGQLFTFGDNLAGVYGPSFRFPVSALVSSTITGAYSGYFDDVLVFYCHPVDFTHLNPVIMPGSTITMVRPCLKKHGFWMAWSDLDLNFVPLLKGIKDSFGYKTVLDQDYEDFTLTILGVEAK